MRFSIVTAVATALLAAGVATVPAQAQGVPASFLILRVAQGDSIDGGAAERMVLLACDPVRAGTHPDSAGACAELAAAGGSFGQLRGGPMRMCTFIYQPVTVAADGLWEGTPVSYRQTFGNQCMADNHSTTVFHF
ncbi:SSI family serine proteinase inhibitor [Nocardia stercoris]|uniref:Protease inhibitor protein n=1 Tax=Nocardia stercoris TaxID=2483361 RepID=A0A3M2KYZ4_9NOCA|nr:SSI family serine proteinase inhibitor [Nocardia stercoris]RMI29493.1 protease inhibitor protein [Nocardia stercoris]